MKRWVWLLVVLVGICAFAQETEIPLPEGAVARFGLGTIRVIAYSPDGDLIAVGTSLGVELRDAKSLDLIQRLTGHTGVVTSIAFSPDGRTLVSGSADKTIRLWSVSTATLLRTLVGHTACVESVALSPDGDSVAAGACDGTIKLWDMSSGRHLRTLEGHETATFFLFFTPDGRTLASGSWGDNVIKLWNASNGELLRTLFIEHGVSSIAISPDGATIAVAGLSNTMITLLDASSGTLLRMLEGHAAVACSLSFSPDGRILASGSGDATTKLWNTLSGALLRTLFGHTTVSSTAFSPDGSTLASGSDDGIMRLWDVSSGDSLRILSDHSPSVTSVAFSNDGESLASGSGDGTIRLWNTQQGTLIRTLTGHTDRILSVAFVSDKNTLASGSWDDTVKLWNASSGTLLSMFSEEGCVTSVDFSRNGNIVACGLSNGITRVWDVTKGTTVAISEGLSGVSSVAVSLDGERLVTGLGGGVTQLWDVSSGVVLRSLLSDPSSGVEAVALSSGGYTIASGAWNGTIRIWSAWSGILRSTLSGHTVPVSSVAFSPDENTLASGAWDNTIKLWDVSTGTLLQTLTGHTDFVFSVSFSADGETLASGSWDGTVLLWDVASILDPNELPTASFTWQALSSSGTRLVVEPRTGDRIEFDASASSDPDGEIVEYAWDWKSNGSYDQTTTDSVIEHTFSSSGSHQVTLRVTDDDGATGTITKTIAIGAKQSPDAAFIVTPSSPSTLDTIQFTDSSSDPDGSISSWHWNFGDGLTSTARNSSHRFTEKGMFTVQLTVTDNDGLIDSVTKTITIRNLLPEARFSIHPPGPLPHQLVSFDASESSDADGNILVYRWDFDGDSVTDHEGVSATWTFAEPGDYAVKLEVEDEDQGISSSSQQIAVSDVPLGSPGFSDLWAVVIGVGTYQNSELDLNLPENDARAVYNFLVDQQSGGFPQDNVRLLINENATKNAIEQAWGWLLRQADEDDLVVIYFAGHGGHDDDYNGDEPEGDTQDEYLYPYDIDISDIFSTAIRDDIVGDWARSLRSESVILIFDSCHSGGAARAVRGHELPGARSASGNTVFTDLMGEGLLVMAACQAAETAKQDDELGHGVFTYFLLSGLGGLEETNQALADADNDERVSVDELRVYLEQAVPEYVSSMVPSCSPQNPMITGDEALVRTALSGYGIPLIGEVSTIDGDLVIITLGTRHGIQPGDQFEVIRPLSLPDGSVVNEVEATIEVLYILGPNRAGCRIIEQLFPIQVKDQVHPAAR